MGPTRTYTAFAGARRLAAGSLPHVTSEVTAALNGGVEGVIVFADDTGRAVDIDPRPLTSGPAENPADESSATIKPARGRPRLGVTAREVTLLPRHWDWLASQPGGASATLRRLVEQARRDNQLGDLVRESREAAHRVLTTLAGNLPGYEEALRALYAGDTESFARCLAPWPQDVQLYIKRFTDREASSGSHSR